MKLQLLLVVVLCAVIADANQPELVWTYEPPAGYVDTSPVLGDLDGDSNADIVVGTTAGMLVAIDSNMQELWRQEVHSTICVPPSIGDVANSTGPEVVIMTRQGQIVCYAGSSGEMLWEAASPDAVYWGETSLALADVNGDGSLEIVTGDRSGNVLCLNGAGETLWLYKGQHGVNQSPAIADLTGDGIMSVLVGGDKIPLVCLSAAGKELWRSESGIGSSPLVYDINGDGAKEILVAVDENFTVRDAAGKIRWAYEMQREMDSAITVADANMDGEAEIYVVDLAGNLACLSSEGKLRWAADVEERVRRSPSVGDVDGDGAQEILVAGYSNAIHVFDPEGGLKARVPLPGGVNSTAVLIPLHDGTPGVLVPVSGAGMQLLRWPNAQPDATLLWPEYRYDGKRTGDPQASAILPPVEIEMDAGHMYAGSNMLQVVVKNSDKRELEVRLEAIRNTGAPAVDTIATSDPVIEHRLSYTVPANQAINLTLNCTVLEEERILARRTHTAYLAPFMKELGDASRALTEVELLLPTLIDSGGLEERACLLKQELEHLEPCILAAGALNDGELVDLRNAVHAFLDQIKQLQELTRAASLAAEAQSTILVCAANPWAPFGGMDEIKEERLQNNTINIEAFSGETESAALNIFNLSNKPRTFRVEPTPLACEDKKVMAYDAMTLHEVVAVPTEMRDFSEDALPLLNSASLIQVPAWGGRQLWFNINTSVLEPGTWQNTVTLRSLDIDPVTAQADIAVTVWPVVLPKKQAVSLCHWGYVHSSVLKDFPEEALADQLRNGTNVFVGLFYPRAEYNEQGEIVGEIDFTAHDDYVKRHAPHGTVLFCGYQGALKGPGGQESDAYAKAHVKWLRAWVAHLKELGVGYEGFALYPVDEPGLSDGLVDLYLRMAKLAREADPNIQMYTDPVGRITEAELREMVPYVDIWCPNRNGLILDENNAAKLEIIKASGNTVWMYECDGNVKHQSPLGYYRAQAWLAWQQDMTGIGFWSYCTSRDDPWFRPALRHDYLMVYPGDGVVTSKRWEAVRDGVEDYTMLAELSSLVETPLANATAEDLGAAKTLLSEGVYAIAQFCGLDDDDTLPGTDGQPGVRKITDTRWEKIQETRRNLAGLLSRLEASK